MTRKLGSFLKLPTDLGKFSFGATSSTVTSLGIIFGLITSGNPRATVIGSLLVIAIADNIADSLGIHIYRELIVAPWQIVYRISDTTVFVLSVIDSRQNVEDILLHRLLR